MLKRILPALIAGACLVALAGTAGAAAPTGKELFTAKGCPACHGADAKTSILPAYPKLAGQNAEYLLLSMKAYKAQERKSKAAMPMWGMAAQLSDDEMQAIAQYLSKLK